MKENPKKYLNITDLKNTPKHSKYKNANKYHFCVHLMFMYEL